MLLPAIVGLHAIAVWITDRRILWRPVAYTVAGVVLGLVINPYFPQNIAFIVDHLGEKVDIGANVRVGNEWYPYTTGDLMENSLGALLALAAGILAGSFRKVGRDQIETTVLFVALLMLYMVFRSRRFIEYYPIFALLFCAHHLGALGNTLARHPANMDAPVFSQKCLSYHARATDFCASSFDSQASSRRYSGCKGF